MGFDLYDHRNEVPQKGWCKEDGGDYNGNEGVFGEWQRGVLEDDLSCDANGRAGHGFVMKGQGCKRSCRDSGRGRFSDKGLTWIFFFFFSLSLWLDTRLA